MPPRNNPLPAAVRLFNCTICDKGYPRQLDYENHLRSYDHNHRQRLADMKKLTASNDSEGSKPRQGPDMRSIDIEGANKKPGVGSRFTKIGGVAAAGAGGGRFKKVGVAVGGKEGDQATETKKIESLAEATEDSTDDAVKVISTVAVADAPVETIEDTAMVDRDDEDAISWEEYDFTKPTGCHHTTCPGCKTDGIWSGEWVVSGIT